MTSFGHWSNRTGWVQAINLFDYWNRIKMSLIPSLNVSSVSLTESRDVSIESISIWFYFWENLESSEGLELCFLCVRAEYCGCGLAGRLAEETIRLAVDRGLGFVKSNPTTEATFRVFRKLGFQLIRQMKLADYSDGTEAAFPHAQPDDCVGMVVKNISK